MLYRPLHNPGECEWRHDSYIQSFYDMAVLKLIEYKSGPVSNRACNTLKEVALSHKDLD